MTFSLRHIILLVGIATIITSFLFFGRDTDTYDILLAVGLVISTISFFVILLKKDTIKSKVIWIIIVFGFIGLQRLTEPMLIKFSYNIFINNNKSTLTRLNNIFLTKNNGDILFVANADKNVLIKFTDTEIAEIQQIIAGTNISLIEKDNQRVFYRTFRMLDVSHGVYYFYGKDKPGKRYKHISDNWYY